MYSESQLKRAIDVFKSVYDEFDTMEVLEHPDTHQTTIGFKPEDRIDIENLLLLHLQLSGNNERSSQLKQASEIIYSYWNA